jgi:ABC-type bacteriocin/lantibiotic exporter with double-glycine peptidase domain
MLQESLGNIKSISSLFDPREKKILILISLLSLLLGFLDLVGVALIGVIGSLGVVNFGGGAIGDRVAIVLRTLRIDGFEVTTQIVFLSLLTSLFLVSKSSLSIVFTRKSLSFLANRSAVLSSQLVSDFFSQPMTGLRRKNTQETIYALTSGVQTLTVGVVGIAITLVADLSLLVILSAGLFLISPETTVISLVTLGSLAILLYKNSQKKVKETAKQQGKLEVASAQSIQSLLTVYRELLVVNRRSFFISRIIDIRFRIAAGQAKLQFFANLPKFTLEIALVAFSVILALYQFSFNTPTRAISIVIIFIVAGLRIIPAIVRLQNGIFIIKANYAKAIPTLDTIRDLKFVSNLKIQESSFDVSSDELVPTIEIQELYFGYDGRRQIFQGLNLNIKPGCFTAIWGKSGQGKSTLVDIMLGIIEPNSGKVLISGLEPKTAFARWPNKFSYVSQNAPVVDGTIRENLSLGFSPEEFSEEELWSSLKKVNLDEFVRELPNGIETEIGDSGSRLSGGQRQRLAIARALVIHPQLLILDEALSALDSENKLLILTNLSNINPKITLIMVTHDMALAKYFHEIYQLKRGHLEKVKTYRNRHKKR